VVEEFVCVCFFFSLIFKKREWVRVTSFTLFSFWRPWERQKNGTHGPTLYHPFFCQIFCDLVGSSLSNPHLRELFLTITAMCYIERVQKRASALGWALRGNLWGLIKERAHFLNNKDNIGITLWESLTVKKKRIFCLFFFLLSNLRLTTWPYFLLRTGYCRC